MHAVGLYISSKERCGYGSKRRRSLPPLIACDNAYNKQSSFLPGGVESSRWAYKHYTTRKRQKRSVSRVAVLAMWISTTATLQIWWDSEKAYRSAWNSTELDWRGIEPRTFCMRSKRDTPTPSALHGLDSFPMQNDAQAIKTSQTTQPYELSGCA